MLSSQRAMGLLYLALFTACVPAANWLIQNIGTLCLPQANGGTLCLIPVMPPPLAALFGAKPGEWLMAPSAVLVVGLAFVLRDLLQRRLGLLPATGAILLGAALSSLLAPPELVIASGVAFLLAELADLLVYTPLQRNRLVLAVFASSIVGLVVDSVLFLQLAFGSLDFLWGQVIGKSWMVLAALPVIWLIRQRELRLGWEPAR
ncbi:MAG: VUT family protein [Pseudomonadota bacterium]